MLGVLAEEMAMVPGDKVAGTLWDLLNNPSADISVAAQVQQRWSALHGHGLLELPRKPRTTAQ